MDPAPVPDPAAVLQDNLERVRTRIRAARAGGVHAADAVDLVVVTKSMVPAIFGLLHAAGVREVGENRVQAVAARRKAAPAGLRWHGIGHLQRNKAATALDVFDVFHALDSLRLADRLETLLAARAATLPVYVQVNAAEDPDKSGFPPDEALAALADLADRPHLLPIGFMTMAARGAEEGDLRSTFSTLRGIRNEALRLGRGRAAPAGLSMGMSDDFEIAIEEGATVVRVGRAVFEGVDLPGTSPRPDQDAASAHASDGSGEAHSPMEPS